MLRSTIGGMALLDGRITAGELLAASRYAVLGAGLGGLTGVFGQLARTRAGVQRVAEVFAVEPVAHGTRTLPAGRGWLEFRRVTVRAEGSPLLDGVDLTTLDSDEVRTVIGLLTTSIVLDALWPAASGPSLPRAVIAVAVALAGVVLAVVPWRRRR